MKKLAEIAKQNKFVIGVISTGIAVLVIALSLLMRTTEPTTKKPIVLGTSGDIAFTEDKGQYHTSEEGTAVIIPLSLDKKEPEIKLTPQTVWESDTGGSSGFTMPEQARMDDSSIGILTIPKIGLSSRVYESDDQMEDMAHGIAHFKSTSAWNGLIGLSAHNINFSGTNGIFLNVYQLRVGDEIEYTTALGTRTYVVTESKTIEQSDWSDLGRSDTNTIVLITCISGKPTQRLCVIATEKN